MAAKDGATLEELVAEYVDLRERDDAPSIDVYVARHPERADELRAALARVVETESLFPASPVGRPDAIGPWRVVGELGRGGMGRVLRVVHAEDPTGTQRALKLLAPGALLNPRAVERIRREGKVLASLKHPGIVRVVDVGEGDEGPYLVMELVEGRSLGELVRAARAEGRRPPLPLPGSSDSDPHLAVARLGARLARSVAAAHSAGLLHRDLKPSNVLVRGDGRPVLIDFGLAVTDGSATLTASGDLLGTPHYMAPEQARGERADARTDVFGLGAVLYELLTLRTPQEGSEPLSVLERIRRRTPLPVRRREPGTPAPLARILDRALAFRRARRTAEPRLVAEDLEAYCAGRPVRARRRGVVERAEDAWRARPLAFGAALGLLLLVAVALVARATKGVAGPSLAEEVATTLRAATNAWLDESPEQLAASADRLVALDPTDARADVVRHLAGQGPLPLEHADPLVAGLAEGLLALEEDRDSDAERAFRVAAELAGSWQLPVLLLGHAAYEAGDWERAEGEWTAASRILPPNGDLDRHVGRARRRRGDLEGAIRSFRRACEREPDDWRNAGELARALAQLGEDAPLDEALAVVDEALARAPGRPRMLLNVRAVVLDRMGRRDDARALYREVLARFPEDAATAFNLGYSYDLECRMVEAREAYRRVLDAGGDDVRSLVALANIAAGGNPSCDDCVAVVRANPDLVRPDRVIEYLDRALEADGGRSPWLPESCVTYAKRVDRAEDLARVLEERLHAHERSGREVDAEVVRLERALRKLRDR